MFSLKGPPNVQFQVAVHLMMWLPGGSGSR
jgi:hypothetical protein